MKKESEGLEYVKILKALKELPFQVGRKLLIDFLRGNYKNKSVTNNRLDELYNFDTLHLDEDKIHNEIDRLIKNGMIELGPSDYNRFVKVLKLTVKGNNEIVRPTLEAKKLGNKVDFKIDEVSKEDLNEFENYNGFLEGYNDNQKKAIVSSAKNILCVAGAGSGKTTVLTKRISFLVEKKGVLPSEILAITFTRKARQEMQKRLLVLGIKNVDVHTFNSFCEGILRKHSFEIYGRVVNIQTYADKILAMNMALGNLGIDMEEAIQRYFTSQQRRLKTPYQLANSFMNDCFSVMEYFKATGQEEYDFSKDVDGENKMNAKMIYQIVLFLKEHMYFQGQRDFLDQMIDSIKFLKENPIHIPRYTYVLVDEYQDVNSMQVDLIKLLNPENLFAVGDPRQSIFGWRGSDINFILNFEKDYGDCQVVHLTKNYRSSREIVEFMNHSIRDMGLSDLEHGREIENSSVEIVDLPSEEAEKNFVIKEILKADVLRKEIFVLARTNRQLLELSQLLKQRGISHVIKTDEVFNPKEGGEGDVTLATIHAIKGLEAKKVIVIGCTDQNFPCKASDHPAIEMIKNEDYDKLEEERRLFYVAISRAKEKLYLTYTGKKPTYFITDKMMKMGRVFV